MKKQYSRNQISEAIKYWKNVLNTMNESKSPLLDACSKEFGEDIVFDDYKMMFELSDKNINSLFNVIDDNLFSNRLKTLNNLRIYVGNESKLDPIATKLNNNHPFSLKPYLALYFPCLNYLQHKITKKIKLVKVSDGMFLNVGNHRYAECAYMISSLCHEMIHCYDANFSYLLKWTEWMLNNGHTQDEINDGSHFTNTFDQKCKEMKSKNGITIQISGNNMDFEELNKNAYDEISLLKEDDDLSNYELFAITDEFREKYRDLFSFNGLNSACMIFGQRMPK